MSKLDYSVLDNYSEADIKRFNKEVENLLESSSVHDDIKNAVAYFYLTLNKIENEPKGDELFEDGSVHYSLVVQDFRVLTGKIMTSLDILGLSQTNPKQDKAIKDTIKQLLRDELWEIQKMLSRGKWGESVSTKTLE